MTFPPSNQLAHQQDEQKAQPGKVFITRGSNPPMFGSTEVPRISTIETVQPINYNSVKKKEVRACYMLKSEFTKPALNSKLQSQSDHTHFTLSTVKRKRQNQKPMQTLSLILPSRKSRWPPESTKISKWRIQSKQLSHTATLPQKTKCALYQVMKPTPLQTSLFSPHQLSSQLTSHRSYRVQVKCYYSSTQELVSGW